MKIVQMATLGREVTDEVLVAENIQDKELVKIIRKALMENKAREPSVWYKIEEDNYKLRMLGKYRYTDAS